ncbi:MAG: RNA polymerase sigma factor [Bacteroidota bacterium]
MDPSAFKQIFDDNHRKVFNICLNMLQSVEDAEDITQEVLLEVHNSAHSFDNRSLVSTWVYRIAVNKSLDFLKAKTRKKRFAFITQLFHPITGEVQHDVAQFDHPGALLENKERTQILFATLNQLPANQRSAFVLSKMEGFSHKEIALIMKLSEKAVEGLVRRAKDNMRELLGKMYEERGI